MQASFLEAHYYAGGLRHRAYTPGSARPVWAPDADIVGFSDEFRLTGDVAAVEVRRLEHERQRLTWVAVYRASIDARLGDRRNHAGIGVWLNELAVVDARSLVHGLDVLTKKLSESVDPDGLAGPAGQFLQDYVPKYVIPLGELPPLRGLQYSSGRLASTRLVHIQSDQSLGDSPQVGDQVLGALYSTQGAEAVSRELICVSPQKVASDDAQRFCVASEADDPLSRIIRELPAATRELTAKLDAASAQLETAIEQRDAAAARAAEFDDMQDRLRAFENDPLNAVLNAVREVSRKIDSLSTQSQQRRDLIPTPVSPRGSRVINHPPRGARAIAEPEPDSQIDWFSLSVVGILVVLVAVIIVLVVDKYVVPFFW